MRSDERKTGAHHPLLRCLYWVAGPALIYKSGLSFTTLLLEPGVAGNGIEWLWAALFPPLLLGFSLLAPRLGCGPCDDGEASPTERRRERGNPVEYSGRMPGI